MHATAAPVVPIHSKDELRERFVSAMADEMTHFWSAGDCVLRAVRDLSPKERREVVKEFAAAANCTAAAVSQRLGLSESFGTESRMLPGATFSMCRAALNAAKRVMRKPSDVLREALEHGWSIDRLNTIGRGLNESPAVLRTACSECGGRFTIRYRGGAGLKLACPICAVTRGSTKRAAILGSLK